MTAIPSIKEEKYVFQSPYCIPNYELPEVPLTDYAFDAIEKNYEVLKDKIWVADVIKGTSYKFRDIKSLTEKFASAITRLGFKKGEVLYFVTYDVALIFIVQLAVWRCGGAVRGCFQRELKEEYERQLREVSSRFILCDPETAPSVTWASNQLDWPVQLLSIGGSVEGAKAVEEMIRNDDGSAFPRNVVINPKEDIISMPNTSGSTGYPKGVMHTHYNLLAFSSIVGSPIQSERTRRMGRSMLTLMGNFAVGSLINLSCSLIYGFSYYSISKFDNKSFLKYLLKYEPETVFLYPYVANWFAREPEVEKYDFSFMKEMVIGGSVLDLATVKLLSNKLPHVKLNQVYGMTECLLVTSTGIYQPYGITKHESNMIAGLKIIKHNGEIYVSSGVLRPLAQAKVVNASSGCVVGPFEEGILWIKAPHIMKGYVSTNKSKVSSAVIDKDGWLNTGDLGFFDDTGHLYLLERESSIFKYYMHQVSPAEIEAVIGEHPAVLSVGVVGIPDPLTTSAARAYVVLKPNHHATENEIKQYVAERKIFYKHLHGGVQFVDSLPESRGGKLDRPALVQMAIKEYQSSLNG